MLTVAIDDTLQEGLGSENGISLLFARMRKLTWGMTTYKCLELVVLLFSKTSVWAAISGAEQQIPALLYSHASERPKKIACKVIFVHR